MFGEKNILLDGLCLVVLIFLVRYAFTQQYVKHASRSTLAKHAADVQLKKFTSGVSNTASKVKKHVEKSVHKALGSKQVQFNEQTSVLLQQLKDAQTTLDKADLLNDKERTALALDIKTIRSRIQHIQRESTKEPQELGLLSGPALYTAREVHKRSLDKKLLHATNNTSSVLLTLHNELLGQDKKINPATSVSQGLQLNQSLII